MTRQAARVWTLDAIRALPDPVDRVDAVREYDRQLVHEQFQAHRIRDVAVAELLRGGYSLGTVSLMTQLSIDHVQAIRGDR